MMGLAPPANGSNCLNSWDVFNFSITYAVMNALRSVRILSLRFSITCVVMNALIFEVSPYVLFSITCAVMNAAL